MNRAVAIRVASMYVPLLAASTAGLLRRGGARSGAARRLGGCLLSLIWTLATLLAVQRLNEVAGWWSFAGGSIQFAGMPLELYLGWAMLWGLVPQLTFLKWPVLLVAALMTALDVVAMPLCRPVVRLSPHWLVGEAVAVALVLLPALCAARWTMDGTHLNLRAALQVAAAGMLFIYVVPEIVFALRPGKGWRPLLDVRGWRRQLWVQGLALLAVPGVSAVMDFAQRGGGTPIPYDPPRRLVASGMYRYCANPMQLSCALVMLLWAGLLRNGWLAVAACTSAIYSAGIANWDERQDLAHRFGDAWLRYRTAVPSWWMRWRPYHAGTPARLYIAATCGPCTELRNWLEARRPLGMELVEAETLPFGSIRRLRYEPGDGCEPVEGVRALARALEHLQLGWALCGAMLRLPVVWQVAQLLGDASGFGPRIVGEAKACGTK